MTFQEKLYRLRKKAGMTQAELAEKLQVSRQTISRWELGSAMPEIETLIAISDLFDVSLDYLLREKAVQAKTQPEEPLPPVPQYWDYLPKLWLILAFLSVLCRLCPYFTEMFFIMNAGAGYNVWSWISKCKLLWIFFNPPIAYLASAVFAALTALCFLWALYCFLKARK